MATSIALGAMLYVRNAELIHNNMRASTTSQIPGVLYYASKPISNPDTFRNIGALQKELMELGYKKSLFEKHYYNGNHTTNNQTNVGTNSNLVHSQSNTQYTGNASQREKFVSESAPQMSLEKYIIHDFKDATWFNQYIESIGEDAFWNYKRKLYLMLYNLEVGQSIEVLKWTKPENLDLFMKICCCYVQESRCNYQFNNEFTIITHKYDDAREMESTLDLLRRKRREKETGGDGTGTGSGIQGTVSVPAP